MYYGATHDVYSWVPKRVEWRHPRTHGLVGTLAAYSVQLGRKLLMPEQNTMARRAIKVWRLMRDRYSPTLPQALDHVWRHNTWSPRTREYTWRVLSGLQYTSAMQWAGALEAWQVACLVCLSNGVPADECADTIAHRYGQCSLAAMAWRLGLDEASPTSGWAGLLRYYVWVLAIRGLSGADEEPSGERHTGRFLRGAAGSSMANAARLSTDI